MEKDITHKCGSNDNAVTFSYRDTPALQKFVDAHVDFTKMHVPGNIAHSVFMSAYYANILNDVLAEYDARFEFHPCTNIMCKLTNHSIIFDNEGAYFLFLMQHGFKNN